MPVFTVGTSDGLQTLRHHFLWSVVFQRLLELRVNTIEVCPWATNCSIIDVCIELGKLFNKIVFLMISTFFPRCRCVLGCLQSLYETVSADPLAGSEELCPQVTVK